MNRHHPSLRCMAAGFSLIEVLVTIVLVATGLLGFAKLQAAAIVNTQTARVRSLAAFQASSLAGAMYANRRFWASDQAPASLTVAGGSVRDPAGVLSAGVDCRSRSCSPAQIAASDLQRWAADMQAQFPSHLASVSCASHAAQPPRCSIELSWTERSVAINRSTLSPSMSSTQRYDLYVEP